MTRDTLSIEALKKLIESQRPLGGVLPPRSIERWSVEAVAEQMNVTVDDACAALDVLVETMGRDVAIEKRLSRAARRHHDGTYSYSYSPSTYEALRYPDADELEALLAAGRYPEADRGARALR